MYIDCVVVKYEDSPKKYLFQAPAFSYLQADQIVTVDSEDDVAKVVSTITLDVDSESFKFIVDALGAKLPLKKVTGQYIYKEFEYKEDEKDGTAED